jgi:AAHS family 4-hydroxybenzoate transporter-like MFS transporter
MQHEETCNISRVVQDQTSGRFAFALLAWCFVIVLLDGYDQIAIAYAAPALVKAWHAKAGDFAPVFGVGLFGVLVGSLLLGFVGDRLGRKRTIIYGSLAFGLLTMACAAASSIGQMTVLRFLAGIGMGGVVPNTVALVAEYAPRQRRATWVTLMFSGFSVGASGGGAVSSWLLPQFGWQIIFLIGGAAAVVVAFASFHALPESIRFLVLKERNHAEIVRLVQRMFPARPVTQGTRFVLDDEAPLTRASPRALFGSGLRYVTPLLWAVFILNSLALALSRLVDRHGMMVIGVLAALGCPVAASLGHAMPQAVLMAAVFMSGVCVIGTQFGLYALAGSIYPTPVRSLGVGTAIGVGKFGSIAGSMLGGVLLAMHLPIGDLFMNVALLFVFITAFAALLAVSHRSVARDGVQRTV